MMKSIINWAAVVVALNLCSNLIQPVSAAPVVIDFEGLEQAGNSQQAHGKSYTEKGFNFAINSQLHNLATYETGSTYYFGSTALWNGDGSGSVHTTLTKVGGGAFDLLSIDLAELWKDGAASVTFEGAFSGGGTISKSVTLDGFRTTGDLSSFETVAFGGFSND